MMGRTLFPPAGVSMESCEVRKPGLPPGAAQVNGAALRLKANAAKHMALMKR
jgi:hypothetical protein